MGGLIPDVCNATEWQSPQPLRRGDVGWAVSPAHGHVSCKVPHGSRLVFLPPPPPRAQARLTALGVKGHI